MNLVSDTLTTIALDSGTTVSANVSRPPCVDPSGFVSLANGTGIQLFKGGYGVYHTAVFGGREADRCDVLGKVVSAVSAFDSTEVWMCAPSSDQAAASAVNACGAVAFNSTEARQLLTDAEAVMKSSARERSFDPTPERKMLLLALGEADVLLQDGESARIVADIAKMGRGRGVALLLSSKTASQEGLGGQYGGRIRDNVLMGNVILLSQE